MAWARVAQSPDDQGSVAVDGLVLGEMLAIGVPLDEREIVRTTVAPELEDVFALHPEAVEADAMTVCPAQASKDGGVLGRVALVSVGAVLAVVANGNVRLGGR